MDEVEKNRRTKAAKAKARKQGFRGTTRMSKILYSLMVMPYEDIEEYLGEWLEARAMTKGEWHDTQ